jgi:predicted dehydrogenase
MSKRKINVAMIGYDFMGRAHSNAWRQVARFFKDVPFQPVLKVVCGRTESKVAEAREQLGFEEHATRWQDVVARPDIDIVDICTPGDSHAGRSRSAGAGSRRRRSGFPVRAWPGAIREDRNPGARRGPREHG